MLDAFQLEGAILEMRGLSMFEELQRLEKVHLLYVQLITLDT